MIRSTFTLLLLICISHLFSQNTMYVQDPQDWWWNENNASVENIELTIRPVGLFAEVKFAFDLKSEDFRYFGTGIPLEYVFEFNMPEEIVFNESWLWIDDYISVGEIYEAGEGTQIYEDIVDRRQDPSILTKHSSRKYSLRVYPLDPDSTRRVQLSYLTPFEFNNREAEVSFPLEIFNNSSEVVQNVSLKIINTSNWSHYEPVDYNYQQIDTEGSSTNYRLNDVVGLSDITVRFMPSNASTDYYFGTYDQGAEKFYQFAYFPEINQSSNNGTHLILLDYDKDHSYGTTPNILLNTIENELKENLGPADMFNIVYADFVSRFAFSEWQVASDENIEAAINTIRNSGFEHETRLTTLLPEALNYIDEKVVDANLHIVSNNADYYIEWEAESFLGEIMEFISEMEGLNSINIMDYADRSRSSWYINNLFYTGNQYFYDQLALLNNGQHKSVIYSDQLAGGLQEILKGIKFLVTEYNLDLDPDLGFVFQNYGNIESTSAIDLSEAIISTGKYVGEYPFQFEFEVLINDELISQELFIERSDALLLNNMAEKVWNGYYLRDNEFDNSFPVRSKVIETSIEHSLLSAQTIFLCLEPDTTAVSSSSFDPGDITISVDEAADKTARSLDVYPNPFSDNFTVKLPLQSIDISKSTTLQLFNTKGQLVAEYTPELLSDEDHVIIEWQSSVDLEDGMYLLRIINDKKVFSSKVMCLNK